MKLSKYFESYYLITTNRKFKFISTDTFLLEHKKSNSHNVTNLYNCFTDFYRNVYRMGFFVNSEEESSEVLNHFRKFGIRLSRNYSIRKLANVGEVMEKTQMFNASDFPRNYFKGCEPIYLYVELRITDVPGFYRAFLGLQELGYLYLYEDGTCSIIDKFPENKWI